MNRTREVFQPYLERRFQQAGAITYGEKLQVIEQLIFETKEGQVPVSADQVIRLNRENPAVVAVREGQNISLDGRAETNTTISPKAKAKRNALYALLLLSLLPLLGGLWWFASTGEAEVTTETATLTAEASAILLGSVITPTVTADPTDPPQPTAIPTMTPLPTFTPVPIDPETFEVDVTNERPLSANNNPIALQFLGQEYRVTTAPLTAAWEPDGIEWWPGTHVRRVLAMPYQEAMLGEIFQSLGDPILIRLRTGQAVAYTLEDIQRVHALEIQHLTASTPSLALILYGEESDQRWLITGQAVQEATIPTNQTDLITTKLDFLTIYSCTHTGHTVSCEIEVTEPTYLNQLTLTDQAWLDALDQLPVGGRQPTSTHTAQLSGTVRGTDTAVIVWRVDDQLAVHLLQPTDFEQGEP